MKKKIHLIGNAHLDPIWLWRWQEGCGEVLQTFRSALDRLSEYDNFIFTCSSAEYYRWVEEIDPDMFAEIVKRVKQGRWVPVNGWSVQPDCNIPCGESFARQALYNQLYYYKKFGVICHTGYNVDSFGHCAMLPQLLVKGGMRTYVMMRPGANENPEIPQNLFWWSSADGSRVLTYHIPYSYADSGIDSISSAVKDFRERADETNHAMMLFYGVGNHGGGPTKGDIEYLISEMGNDENPMEFSSPDDYFDDVCADRLDLPVWQEDLQHHASGCYSATSIVKQLNRKAENMLISAEKWSTVANKAGEMPAKTDEFADAWRDVCFNQFHDVLCGCSIVEAYDDVRDSMGHAMTIAARNENTALLKIASKINTWLDGVADVKTQYARHHCRNLAYPRPVVVFNPLSYEVETAVRTYHPSKRVQDSEGNDIPFQNVRSSRSNDTHNDTVFTAKVPALGYATYWLWLIDFENDDEYDYTGETDIKACEKETVIENEHLRVAFSQETGGITSLVSKADGNEFACGGSFCVPQIIDNSKPDTWAHNIFKFDKVIGEMKLKSIELVEEGPVRALVRTVHTYGNSVLTQDFILASGAKLLRVKCKAIWQEPLTILKMPFALDGKDGVSTYEIPAGFIKRPCNGEEEPAQNWADLTVTGADGKRRGLALISDSKYSFDCPGNELRITLLRNSICADHYSYRPPANFDYTDEGLQRFEYAVLPHTGEAEASDVSREGALFNCRPVTVPVSYQKGTEPLKKSFMEVDAPNVIATAFKLCEDGSGDSIIRCCETCGKETRAMIKCDLINAAFYADFGKNEIKTFRINSEGFVAETNFLEGIVSE